MKTQRKFLTPIYRILIMLFATVFASCTPEDDDTTSPAASSSSSTDFYPPVSNQWVDTTNGNCIVFFASVSSQGDFIGDYGCDNAGDLIGKVKNFDISFRVLTGATSYEDYTGKYIDTSSTNRRIKLFRAAEGDTVVIRPF